MPTHGTRTGWFSRYALTAVDVLAYAAVVTVLAIASSLVVGVATGGGVVRAKLLLFLAGWLLLIVATVRLWPRSPSDETAEEPSLAQSRGNTAESTLIESIADALPPLRWTNPPSRRLSPPLKLFVASLFVLLASLVLEVVFTVE